MHYQNRNGLERTINYALKMPDSTSKWVERISIIQMIQKIFIYEKVISIFKDNNHYLHNRFVMVFLLVISSVSCILLTRTVQYAKFPKLKISNIINLFMVYHQQNSTQHVPVTCKKKIYKKISFNQPCTFIYMNP